MEDEPIATLLAFAPVGAARFNDRGALDVTDFGLGGFAVPHFPFEGHLQVVLLVGQAGEQRPTTVNVKVAFQCPGEDGLTQAHEFLDPWPGPPAHLPNRALPLTYSVPLVARTPGTYGVVAFVMGDPSSRRSVPFEVLLASPSEDPPG